MKRCWEILLRQAVRCSSGCMRTQVEDTPFGTQLFFGVKFSGARLRSASEIEHCCCLKIEPQAQAVCSGRPETALSSGTNTQASKTQQGALTGDY